MLKRTRKNGLQYLYMYEGSVTDDARWLLTKFLKYKNRTISRT
jgi:hypothetical protein